ncbi:MAG: ABC transporter permease [Bacteroidota bacterium]
MTNVFINSFTAEWMKKRRSFADWLVLAGGFFIPLISTIIFCIYPKQLLGIHASGHFWELLSQKAWQMMAFMLLPMGIVLAVSLVTQLEFKNNTWKQLHAAPLPFTAVYFAKLVVLLIMLLQLLLLFNIGIYCSAVIPSLFNSRIPFPAYAMDVSYLLKQNASYFIVCLPLVALQYLVSLQFKNFLIPIGAGLALVIAGLIAVQWKYGYTIPYTYTALQFLQSKGNVVPAHNIIQWSLGYFVLFTLLGYWLYIAKKEKG